MPPNQAYNVVTATFSVMFCVAKQKKVLSNLFYQTYFHLRRQPAVWLPKSIRIFPKLWLQRLRKGDL